MKTIAASAALLTLAAAAPQMGPPGGYGGSWSGMTSDWASWASANGLPTATSAWSSLASDYESWTSAASLTAWPTATSEWSSITSAHPLPSALSSVASSWITMTTPPSWGPGGAWGWGSSGNHSGWSAGSGHGPFGGPGNGWGPWASMSGGAWTSGPWTSWWGASGCPASTWSGELTPVQPVEHLPRACILTGLQAGPPAHGTRMRPGRPGPDAPPPPRPPPSSPPPSPPVARP